MRPNISDIVSMKSLHQVEPRNVWNGLQGRLFLKSGGPWGPLMMTVEAPPNKILMRTTSRWARTSRTTRVTWTWATSAV